jgi:hypothetical protein
MDIQWGRLNTDTYFKELLKYTSTYIVKLRHVLEIGG